MDEFWKLTNYPSAGARLVSKTRRGVFHVRQGTPTLRTGVTNGIGRGESANLVPISDIDSVEYHCSKMSGYLYYTLKT